MLEQSKYYHIYNRSNGWEKMFLEDRNYNFFLNKYRFYIEPIADTYAYCLIPNHLHFLIKVKSETELKVFFEGGEKTSASFRKYATTKAEQTFGKTANLKAEQTFRKSADTTAGQTFGKIEKGGGELSENELGLKISKQFSKLFSCYTQSFNKMYNRKGSLFIPNFKRKEITSEHYLQQIVLYIHNNPVKHKLVLNSDEWNYSSYNKIISGNFEWIKGKETIAIFDSLENFKYTHLCKTDILNNMQIEE